MLVENSPVTAFILHGLSNPYVILKVTEYLEGKNSQHWVILFVILEILVPNCHNFFTQNDLQG
jgi:hypothetical protein